MKHKCDIEMHPDDFAELVRLYSVAPTDGPTLSIPSLLLGLTIEVNASAPRLPRKSFPQRRPVRVAE